jgi:hypothetical protein
MLNIFVKPITRSVWRKKHLIVIERNNHTRDLVHVSSYTLQPGLLVIFNIFVKPFTRLSGKGTFESRYKEQSHKGKSWHICAPGPFNQHYH